MQFQLHGSPKRLAPPSTPRSQKPSRGSSLPVAPASPLHGHSSAIAASGTMMSIASSRATTPRPTTNASASLGGVVVVKAKPVSTPSPHHVLVLHHLEQSQPSAPAPALAPTSSAPSPSIPRAAQRPVLRSNASSASLASVASEATTAQELTLAEVVDTWVAQSRSTFLVPAAQKESFFTHSVHPTVQPTTSLFMSAAQGAAPRDEISLVPIASNLGPAPISPSPSDNAIAGATLHKPSTRSSSSPPNALEIPRTSSSSVSKTHASSTLKSRNIVQAVSSMTSTILDQPPSDPQLAVNPESMQKHENQRFNSTETLVDEWRPSLQDLPPIPATPSAQVLDDEASPEPSVTELATATITDDAANKRVDRILDFLKRVEEEDAVRTTQPSAPGLVSAEVTSKPPPASAAVFDSVKAKIMGQQLEIEEKSRTLAALKKELKKLKDLNKDQLAQSRKDLKSKLILQRKEYETIVKRHLAFVDKLLAEKEDLSKRCESLSEEVRNLDKQFQARIASMEETQSRELVRQKDIWAQGEKMKREKWVAEKTRQIKDATVRGLEPEIQRMLAQHKAAIRALEEKHAGDLARERAQIAESQNRISESLRDRLAEERRKACEEEREFARQRFQKMLEREEMEHATARRKLVAEWDEQRTQIMENAKEERRALEQLMRQKEEESRRTTEVERASSTLALEEARRKASQEMSQLRERLAVEKEEWQSQLISKFEADFRNREKLLREKLVRERDLELEHVIARLESETSSTSSDAFRRHRMEIERIKSEAADQVRELRDQHAMAVDRVIAAQSAAKEAEERAKESERKAICAQDEARSKEVGLEKMRAELKRLRVDEETLASTIRRDFEDQLATLQSEVKSLGDQFATQSSQMEVLRRKHGHELELVGKEKDEALAKLEARVHKTIQTKDEIITSLRSQVEDMSIRSTHLEKLMEKQREELLAA
ncbi:hypothetical protein SeMB42_g05266 [Synchytrium endobioticum]|nr:hypothetical protein SeMB42_g05266 [Synchytrium endobioticum]